MGYKLTIIKHLANRSSTTLHNTTVTLFICIEKNYMQSTVFEFKEHDVFHYCRYFNNHITFFAFCESTRLINSFKNRLISISNN